MRVRFFTPILFWLVVPCWSCGCSTDATTTDAGIVDADAGGDQDPCVAALPGWNQTWQIQQEQSGLEGLTPDINLVDVWGSAADDVYAVGMDGTILHNDGSGWTAMESGTEANLEGVWGYVLHDDTGAVTRTDVFAVGWSEASGEAVVLRYDGTAWTPQRVINDPDPANPDPQPVQGSLHDVWGIPAPGPNPDQHPTVFAVGGEGLIVEFIGEDQQFLETRQRVEFTDGEGNTRYSYQRWTPERLGGVFGASRDFFVAVGNNGAILEYDGGGWNRVVISGFTTHLNGVWGARAGEIFAVGLDGTILLRAGGSWQNLRDNPNLHFSIPPVYLRGLWAFSQPACGPVPDGGTEPQDTSWVVFVGWNNTLFMAHEGIVCPFGKLDVIRFEGVWGTAPRSIEDRTSPDGGITCDPVDIVTTGVNGTIIRLVNEEGR